MRKYKIFCKNCFNLLSSLKLEQHSIPIYNLGCIGKNDAKNGCHELKGLGTIEHGTLENGEWRVEIYEIKIGGRTMGILNFVDCL